MEIGRRVRLLPQGKHGCEVGELCKITELNRAQIAFYEKTGLIGPAYREFTDQRTERPKVYYKERDVLKALIISDLKKARFPVQQIRTAIENLESQGYEFGADTHLLTNGDSVYVAPKPTDVIDILKRNRQMLLLVSIEDQVAKVAPNSA